MINRHRSALARCNRFHDLCQDLLYGDNGLSRLNLRKLGLFGEAVNSTASPVLAETVIIESDEFFFHLFAGLPCERFLLMGVMIAEPYGAELSYLAFVIKRHNRCYAFEYSID